MKVSAAKANVKQITSYDGDEISHESYFKSSKFKAYKHRVENVIKNSKTELTIRQIKQKLGRHLIDNWLWDALDILSRETITTRNKTANITVYRYMVSQSREVNQTMTFNSGITPRRGLPYLDL